MFSITCRTCAAKLKVKNATAIGQRLACPKCGEMVEVVPPPGWIPPEGPGKTPEVSSSAAGFGDFEDIEQIISGGTAKNTASPGSTSPESKSPLAASGKTPATAPLGRPTQTGKTLPAGQVAARPEVQTDSPLISPPGVGEASQTAKRPADRNRERPPGELPPTSAVPLSTVPLSAADKPLLAPRDDKFELTQPREYLPDPNLPPPDWGKRDRSKSQKLLISGLLLVGLLAAIAASIALLNQRGDRGKGNQLAETKQAAPGNKETPAAAAEKNDLDKAAEAIEPRQPEPSPPESDATPKQPVTNDADSDSAGKKEEVKSESPTEQPASPEKQATDTAPMNPAEQESTLPSEQPTPATSAPLPGTEERPDSPLVRDDNPLNKKPKETAGTAGPTAAPSGPTSLTDRLGKLSQLLSGPGTSLTELGDLAESERTDRLVGLPRFLITRPGTSSPPSDPWNIPIAEAQYSGVPLHLFLSEFSTLTGVPMSLDSLAVVGAGTKVDSPVEFDLSNTTTGEILATVLQQLRLERINLEGVEVLAPAGSQVTDVYRFPLPTLSNPSPEKFQQLAERLPKLIDPVSWTLDSANRKVTIEGNELVVSNHSLAAGQVGEFLEKLSAAERLKSNPQDEEAAQRLTSRTQRGKQGLAKPLQLEATLDQPIEQFLAGVYRQSGVAITVDWAGLKAAGWSSSSMVPGDFKADNVEQLLKELSRSLSATWLAIDDHTFELTSFQQASRRATVEVYPLQGLGVEPQPFLEILTQTLGGQLRENPLVQFFYEPEVHALVVVAPQPLQRQFEAIVQRLKKPTTK